MLALVGFVSARRRVAAGLLAPIAGRARLGGGLADPAPREATPAPDRQPALIVLCPDNRRAEGRPAERGRPPRLVDRSGRGRR
jgi:hypothetical protein